MGESDTDGRRWALVTGASAGIGLAFAQRLAGQGWDLVLVARDEDRLRRHAVQLSRQYQVSVRVLAADLSTTAGCELVEQRLTDDDEPIELLINNAGFSLNTPFLQAPVQRELELLAVNVQAVLRLTLAVLPGMTRRGRGGVINVSSVAGFSAAAPGSTYPASKAWVTNFSESMGLAAARHGVRVMALCPGFTRTEFHERAAIDTSAMPNWLWLSASQVADIALRDMRRGKSVSIPSGRYRLLVGFLRHAPAGLVRHLTTRARAKVGR